MLSLALVLVLAANALIFGTGLVLWVKRTSSRRIESAAADDSSHALDADSMLCRAPSPHNAFHCTEPIGHWGWHRDDEVTWWGDAWADDGKRASVRSTRQAPRAPEPQPAQETAPPTVVDEAPAEPTGRTSRRKPAPTETSFASSHLGFSFDDPPYKSTKPTDRADSAERVDPKSAQHEPRPYVVVPLSKNPSPAEISAARFAEYWMNYDVWIASKPIGRPWWAPPRDNAA